MARWSASMLLLAFCAAAACGRAGMTVPRPAASGGSGGSDGSGGAIVTGGTTGSGGAIVTGGTTGSGGATATGGAKASGGISGSGGVFGSGGETRRSETGGAVGTGGTTSVDAFVGLVCSQDGGRGLPSAARGCSRDEDCTILNASNCCGPDDAFGVAVSQANNYLGCLARIGLCGMLGCTKYYGYAADTGQVTTEGAIGVPPSDSVAVHCVNQLCTTEVVPGVDGGRDAPATDASAVDASPAAG